MDEQENVNHWTKLHKLIKENNKVCCDKCGCNKKLLATEELCEQIKDQIKKGTDPCLKEINGDTPLHTAVLENEHVDVLKALIHTKHENCKKADNCTCGQKALKIENNSKRTPRQLEYVSTETLKFLNMEGKIITCLLYTSPSPRDKRQSRMPSSA